MKNNLQSPDLQTTKTPGDGVLGEGAEKYIRNVADIEDLPGDDDDLQIDDDEDYINKDEANRDLQERGLRP